MAVQPTKRSRTRLSRVDETGCRDLGVMDATRRLLIPRAGDCVRATPAKTHGRSCPLLVPRMAARGRTETLANGWDQPEAVGEVLRLRPPSTCRRRSGRPLAPAVPRSRLSASNKLGGSLGGGNSSPKAEREGAALTSSGTYSPSQRRLDKGASLNGCDRRKRAESPCAILVASFFDGAHRDQQEIVILPFGGLRTPTVEELDGQT